LNHLAQVTWNLHTSLRSNPGAGDSESGLKKAILAILVPFFIVASTAIGFVWWERGAPPGFRPTPVDVTVDTITRENRGVRITGTAHYEARLKQHAEGSGETWWLYPLMAKGDTMSRQIRVMVRTKEEPNELYGFEDMTVEGLARPPGRLVPFYVQETLMQKGYRFADDFVVVEVWDSGSDD